MALLGKAALAMWWDIRPEQRAEFGDWHSHEHFPERLSIPGFRRGSRWTSTRQDDGFFVLYELDRYETFTSKGYLDRLNAPTPWSTRMMPHHLLREQPARPGLTGAHLLMTDTPKTIAPTVEQQIRGGDSVADWVVLLAGYDPDVVQSVAADQLSPGALARAGARGNSVTGHYRLALAMTLPDLATM